MSTITPIDMTNAPRYTWGSICESWVMLEHEALSVKKEKMPPGTKECLHYHQRSGQFFYILLGTATFSLDGDTVTALQGQGIFIPPETEHYIANNSENSLELLVISQPPTEKDRVNLE